MNYEDALKVVRDWAGPDTQVQMTLDRIRQGVVECLEPDGSRWSLGKWEISVLHPLGDLEALMQKRRENAQVYGPGVKTPVSPRR